MVSRRRTLQLAGGALVWGTAGCVGGPRPTDETTRRAATTTAPGGGTTSTAEPADWDPAWHRTVTERYVLGLSAVDGALYATLDSEGGPSAVARLSPRDGTVAWRTEVEGEAVTGSYAGHRPIARDQWGVTVTDGSVYSVNGAAESYDWTALHALDRETGDRRWTLRRDRRLAVHGTAAGTVFATGREFFEPEHSHDTPDGPLESVLYAVDAETGAVRWTRTFAGVADVAVGTDAVYVAAGNRLTALGLDGGRRWQFESDRPARAVRAAAGRVYYLADGHHGRSTVHGLDRDGGRAWHNTLDVNEVILDGETLYAGGGDVLALAPDGSTVWRRGDPGGWLLLGPDSGTLYARLGGQATGAYDAATGQRFWSFDPDEKYAWPVAATPGACVVEGYAEGRALYAVDRSSGEARRRYDPSGDLLSFFAAASAGDRVFVGNNRSEVLAFDV